MDTLQFLTTVLPSEGFYALQYSHPQSKGMRTVFADTLAKLAELATVIDERGFTVYFRTASYKTKDAGCDIENAYLRRSFIADIDVKDKKGYDTPQQAANAIVQVLKATKLPIPLIVISGGGFHLYWVLDDDVTIQEWQPIADQLKACLKSSGLKFDAGLTGNPVCLLRPVGTHHRKTETPLPVRAAPKPHEVTHLAALAKVMGATAIQGSSELVNMFAPSNDLEVVREYAPSDAEAVAKHCNFIREFKETGFGGGGLQSEWYDAMGAIRNCVNGADKCHEFSKVADNYDAGSVLIKLKQLEAKNIPAITCQHIDDNYDYCGSCPHRGHITAPIQLGEKQAEIEAIKAQGDTVEGPWWPKHAGWDDAKHEMYVELWNADESTWDKHYISRSKFYVETRIWSDDHTWAFRVQRLKYVRHNGIEVWEAFTIPTAHIARTVDLAAAFAEQEVYMNNRNDVNHLANLLKDYGDVLRNRQIETVMHSAMGWYSDEVTDIPRYNMAYPPQAKGFIIGNRLVTRDGEQEVLLSDNVPSNWRDGFGVVGTPSVWARSVHDMFVKTDLIPYQFIIASEFAAPLVSLMGREEYHGNPISLVGESGIGKSTVCKIAMSVWGDPARLTINGNPSNGVTAKAFQKKLSNLSNMSPLLDEVSKQNGTVLGELIYVVAMGQGRDKLQQNGKPMAIEDPWFSLCKFTSNKPVMEIVTEDDRDSEDTGDAIQKRLFEVNFHRLGYTREQLAADPQLGLKMQELLNTQYGTIGRVWVRYMLNNMDTLIGDLQSEYANIKNRSIDHSAERFHDYMEACVIVACRHLHKARIMHPNVDGIREFIGAVRRDMAMIRHATKLPVEDAFARFLAENQGGLIVTARFPDGSRGRPGALEFPQREVHGGAVGRIAAQDGKAAIAVSPLRAWCRTRGIDFHKLIHGLDGQGYFVHDHETLRHHGKPEVLVTAATRLNVAAGTTIHGSREKCLMLDYARLTGQNAALQLVQPITTEGANNADQG